MARRFRINCNVNEPSLGFSEWTNQSSISALLRRSSSALVSQLNFVIIARTEERFGWGLTIPCDAWLTTDVTNFSDIPSCVNILATVYILTYNGEKDIINKKKRLCVLYFNKKFDIQSLFGLNDRTASIYSIRCKRIWKECYINIGPYVSKYLVKKL